MAKLDALERIVTHHSVTIDTRFRTQAEENVKAKCVCPIPEMVTLAPLIIKKKGLIHTYDSGSTVVTLQDAEFYPNIPGCEPTHLTLLINTVDKNGSTTVVKNTTTNERVEIQPKHEQGEGYEVSAHVVIALNGNMRTYDLLYTVTPGISTARLNSFLDRILFEVSRDNEDLFTAKHPTNVISSTSKKELKILYKPVFDLTGMLDKDLFNKLSQKGLSDVILIKDRFDTINAPDVNASYTPTESTLRILPNHGDNVIGWITNVASHFNQDLNGGYEKLKIKFQDPETSKQRQVDFKTSNINLNNLEKTFVKKSILDGFNSRLKDSYVKIELEFILKMIKLM
ncbi:hypothetical protein [Enterobacter bugandensis]|uniref:hypothetical protein n=1 Tax=Enterobacter bugandensis TaxID=881260 RepID=UPI0021D0A5A2|nr:hypothetical protein [Enterobacter bugandensis]MCU6213594.1 hypothetical protein [Enterobacter bugandensis]